MSKKNNKIYFIRAENGLVKIGKSNNPNYFKCIRKNGEWFRPDYELKSFLNNKRNICITSLIDAYNPRGKFKRYCDNLEKSRLYL